MDESPLLSERLGALLLASKQVMVTAESCTGGGISAAITDIAGSSAWFDRAFITYSNEAKVEMLGITTKTLEQHGAVSEPIVTEMVLGALEHSNGTIAVSVSGIAGPGGGTEQKPVGTVCFGFADLSGWQQIETCHFNGNRAEVRQQVVHYALATVVDYLQSGSNF